ncbi:Crp/Fnr family transcriptional regulator [Mucilaginibacter sp. L3T2-6]|uniref:Crp/Fnr family transcriptional regulator n=1 Tax=Mucilaginibacter sp. L3T2-6 TaxID=3062491 RepID=UPI0026765FBB|nr:Crp/Fnr family transcriptional regulator [Mucilaginibacter sp. L3T2-6]MDO3641367.1 Crp/Fnr family transcriptional regulator [Mucilaginibacter sp. L3T2-6]MDV6213872.1 Crp/Fnr family transcriptional regulator [Mucilaginibacter sp. L3T2-6]
MNKKRLEIKALAFLVYGYVMLYQTSSMFDLLLTNIAKYIHLTEEEKVTFVACLKPIQIKRKQFVLNEGEICRNSVFVNNGCLRGFTVDKNGIEHVLSFAPPGWWIADMYSLISQKPGILNIEALEDTEALILSKAGQEKLYHEIPKFERFFRILTENSLVANQQRIIDNMSLTAEERYSIFCKRYPTLIDHLPQKQIASYIGVTPEFFSRMRAEMVRKKK